MISTEVHGQSIKDLQEYLGDKFKMPDNPAIAFSKEWQSTNPSSDEMMTQAYIDSDMYAYDLAVYNSTPARKAFYTYIKKHLEYIKVKDKIHICGDGICSDSIALALDGYDVSVSDLPSKYFEFGKWRMKKWNVNIECYDIEEIWEKRFSVMIFITVLEHIPNLFEFMSKVVNSAYYIIEKSHFGIHEEHENFDRYAFNTNFSRKQFLDWMDNNGFRKDNIINVYAPTLWRRK